MFNVLKSRRVRIAGAIGAAAVIVVALGIVLFPVLDPKTRAWEAAYEYCKDEIEEQLVAPATAVFPDRVEATMGADYDNGAYWFNGEMDSENRMGVPIRHVFACRITRYSDGTFETLIASVLES